MLISQLGITPFVVAAEKATNRSTIYHDYNDYLAALKVYKDDYAQYQTDLAQYNQDKQIHDDTQAQADRIQQENADKKAAYEKELADYQVALAEYNKKLNEIADHSGKGQYVGPDMWGVYGHLETYLVDYSAIIQMMNTGLSISGDPLTKVIQSDMSNDPYTGSSTIEQNINDVITEWDKYAAYETSIYASVDPIDLDTMIGFAVGGAWYSGFKGVEFYHTYTSTTGQTKDNIPSSLDHPTEEGIKTALADLFTQTNGSPFNSGSAGMSSNTYMVDQAMVAKWEAAVAEAKMQGANLYEQAGQEYLAAYQAYNATEYTSSDYAAFLAGVNQAKDTQIKAMNYISGVPKASLADKDDSAPFYNDLKNLSASELAGKYGYLILLSNMANQTTYGYFHLLQPQGGEVIQAATAVSWSVSYRTFGETKGDHEPTLTEPVEPTPPSYEEVPVVPEEPVKPVPPVKPVYEAQNKITLSKIDKESQKPLANAIFKLMNTDTNQDLGEFTSNNNGLVEITNLDPGNYTLTEVHAPDGYLLDKNPVAFIVHGTEDEAIRLEKTNELDSGGVLLTKTDQESGTVLQGAVFKVVDASGKVIKSGLLTDASGELLVTGLVPGDYQFIETQAPAGYAVDSTPVDFTITANQTQVVKVSKTNKLTLGGVTLMKTDSQSGERLQGAVFELQDKNGTPLKSGLITDDSGKIAVDKLSPGEYQFIETQAPTGYILDTTPIVFTISKGQTSPVQLTMTNQLMSGGVILTKVDSETKAVLQGAIFELQDENGNVLRKGLTTDKSGKIAIDKLMPGNYRFVETQAPTGYTLETVPLTFTIEKNQTKVVALTMTNTLIPGGVVLTKVDSQTGAVLEGAVFELQDSKGNSLSKGLMTDASGKLAVDSLAPGKYQFVETQAPTGYDLDKTPVSFVIEKGQKETVQLNVANKVTPGGVILEKIDSQTGETLVGAVFDLQDKSGHVIMTDLTTDVSGRIAIEGLTPGEYQLVETKAPAGYELDATPVSFKVKKKQQVSEKLVKKNEEKEHSVRIEKQDGETKALLPGAVFKLEDKSGNVIKEEIQTDEQGIAVIDKLESGEYQLVETKAPAGYTLDKHPIQFSMTDEITFIDLAVYNYQEKGGTPPNFSTGNSGKSPSTYLPKTGEQRNANMFLLGTLFVGTAFVLVYIRKKAKKSH